MHWFRLRNGEKKHHNTSTLQVKKKKLLNKKKNNDFKIIELGVNPAVSLITNNEQMDFL